MEELGTTVLASQDLRCRSGANVVFGGVLRGCVCTRRPARALSRRSPKEGLLVGELPRSCCWPESSVKTSDKLTTRAATQRCTA